jgi:hypothetical protein
MKEVVEWVYLLKSSRWREMAQWDERFSKPIVKACLDILAWKILEEECVEWKR